MTKVFLLGSFHFQESGFDFFTTDTQRQLAAINERLCRFEPDAICVEAAVHAQTDVDASYEKCALSDFQDYKKMRNETLGTIHMFGGVYPISYQNEAIQIGYRLGKLLGAKKIHAIDDDTELHDIKEKFIERIEHASQKHNEHMQYCGEDTIVDQLRFYNSEQWSYHHHQLLLIRNEAGAGASYVGANHLGQWYTRNLKIFANLQALSETKERIFALYGCGHLSILRSLVNACENMELVDYHDYL